MFVILDTNCFSELTEKSAAGRRLEERLLSREAQVFLCIVAVEESLQGFLALIRRHRAGRDQLAAYARLVRALDGLQKFPIIAFDADAAEAFHRLQDQRIRVGTMDLKIAAICLAHEALLLTRNLVDFEKVPGLRVENWLD